MSVPNDLHESLFVFDDSDVYAGAESSETPMRQPGARQQAANRSVALTPLTSHDALSDANILPATPSQPSDADDEAWHSTEKVVHSSSSASPLHAVYNEETQRSSGAAQHGTVSATARPPLGSVDAIASKKPSGISSALSAAGRGGGRGSGGASHSEPPAVAAPALAAARGGDKYAGVSSKVRASMQAQAEHEARVREQRTAAEARRRQHMSRVPVALTEGTPITQRNVAALSGQLDQLLSPAMTLPFTQRGAGGAGGSSASSVTSGFSAHSGHSESDGDDSLPRHDGSLERLMQRAVGGNGVATAHARRQLGAGGFAAAAATAAAAAAALPDPLAQFAEYDDNNNDDNDEDADEAPQFVTISGVTASDAGTAAAAAAVASSWRVGVGAGAGAALQPVLETSGDAEADAEAEAEAEAEGDGEDEAGSRLNHSRHSHVQFVEAEERVLTGAGARAALATALNASASASASASSSSTTSTSIAAQQLVISSEVLQEAEAAADAEDEEVDESEAAAAAAARAASQAAFEAELLEQLQRGPLHRMPAPTSPSRVLQTPAAAVGASRLSGRGRGSAASSLATGTTAASVASAVSGLPSAIHASRGWHASPDVPTFDDDDNDGAEGHISSLGRLVPAPPFAGFGAFEAGGEGEATQQVITTRSPALAMAGLVDDLEYDPNLSLDGGALLAGSRRSTASARTTAAAGVAEADAAVDDTRPLLHQQRSPMRQSAAAAAATAANGSVSAAATSAAAEETQLLSAAEPATAAKASKSILAASSASTVTLSALGIVSTPATGNTGPSGAGAGVAASSSVAASGGVPSFRVLASSTASGMHMQSAAPSRYASGTGSRLSYRELDGSLHPSALYTSDSSSVTMSAIDSPPAATTAATATAAAISASQRQQLQQRKLIVEPHSFASTASSSSLHSFSGGSGVGKLDLLASPPAVVAPPPAAPAAPAAAPSRSHSAVNTPARSVVSTAPLSVAPAATAVASPIRAPAATAPPSAAVTGVTAASSVSPSRAPTTASAALSTSFASSSVFTATGLGNASRSQAAEVVVALRVARRCVPLVLSQSPAAPPLQVALPLQLHPRALTAGACSQQLAVQNGGNTPIHMHCAVAAAQLVLSMAGSAAAAAASQSLQLALSAREVEATRAFKFAPAGPLLLDPRQAGNVEVTFQPLALLQLPSVQSAVTSLLQHHSITAIAAQLTSKFALTSVPLVPRHVGGTELVPDVDVGQPSELEVQATWQLARAGPGVGASAVGVTAVQRSSAMQPASAPMAPPVPPSPMRRKGSSAGSSVISAVTASTAATGPATVTDRGTRLLQPRAASQPVRATSSALSTSADWAADIRRAGAATSASTAAATEASAAALPQRSRTQPPSPARPETRSINSRSTAVAWAPQPSPMPTSPAGGASNALPDLRTGGAASPAAAEAAVAAQQLQRPVSQQPATGNVHASRPTSAASSYREQVPAPAPAPVPGSLDLATADNMDLQQLQAAAAVIQQQLRKRAEQLAAAARGVASRVHYDNKEADEVDGDEEKEEQEAEAEVQAQMLQQYQQQAHKQAQQQHKQQVVAASRVPAPTPAPAPAPAAPRSQRLPMPARADAVAEQQHHQQMQQQQAAKAAGSKQRPVSAPPARSPPKAVPSAAVTVATTAGGRRVIRSADAEDMQAMYGAAPRSSTLGPVPAPVPAPAAALVSVPAAAMPANNRSTRLPMSPAQPANRQRSLSSSAATAPRANTVPQPHLQPQQPQPQQVHQQQQQQRSTPVKLSGSTGRAVVAPTTAAVPTAVTRATGARSAGAVQSHIMSALAEAKQAAAAAQAALATPAKPAPSTKQRSSSNATAAAPVPRYNSPRPRPLSASAVTVAATPATVPRDPRDPYNEDTVLLRTPEQQQLLVEGYEDGENELQDVQHEEADGVEQTEDAQEEEEHEAEEEQVQEANQSHRSPARATVPPATAAVPAGRKQPVPPPGTKPKPVTVKPLPFSPAVSSNHTSRTHQRPAAASAGNAAMVASAVRVAMQPTRVVSGKGRVPQPAAVVAAPIESVGMQQWEGAAHQQHEGAAEAEAAAAAALDATQPLRTSALGASTASASTSFLQSPAVGISSVRMRLEQLSEDLASSRATVAVPPSAARSIGRNGMASTARRSTSGSFVRSPRPASFVGNNSSSSTSSTSAAPLSLSNVGPQPQQAMVASKPVDKPAARRGARATAVATPSAAPAAAVSAGLFTPKTPQLRAIDTSTSVGQLAKAALEAAAAAEAAAEAALLQQQQQRQQQQLQQQWQQHTHQQQQDLSATGMSHLSFHTLSATYVSPHAVEAGQEGEELQQAGAVQVQEVDVELDTVLRTDVHSAAQQQPEPEPEVEAEQLWATQRLHSSTTGSSNSKSGTPLRSVASVSRKSSSGAVHVPLPMPLPAPKAQTHAAAQQQQPQAQRQQAQQQQASGVETDSLAGESARQSPMPREMNVEPAANTSAAAPSVSSGGAAGVRALLEKLGRATLQASQHATLDMPQDEDEEQQEQYDAEAAELEEEEAAAGRLTVAELQRSPARSTTTAAAATTTSARDAVSSGVSMRGSSVPDRVHLLQQAAQPPSVAGTTRVSAQRMGYSLVYDQQQENHDQQEQDAEEEEEQEEQHKEEDDEDSASGTAAAQAHALARSEVQLLRASAASLTASSVQSSSRVRAPLPALTAADAAAQLEALEHRAAQVASERDMLELQLRMSGNGADASAVQASRLRESTVSVGSGSSRLDLERSAAPPAVASPAKALAASLNKSSGTITAWYVDASTSSVSLPSPALAYERTPAAELLVVNRGKEPVSISVAIEADGTSTALPAASEDTAEDRAGEHTTLQAQAHDKLWSPLPDRRAPRQCHFLCAQPVPLVLPPRSDGRVRLQLGLLQLSTSAPHRATAALSAVHATPVELGGWSWLPASRTLTTVLTVSADEGEGAGPTSASQDVRVAVEEKAWMQLGWKYDASTHTLCPTVEVPLHNASNAAAAAATSAQQSRRSSSNTPSKPSVATLTPSRGGPLSSLSRDESFLRSSIRDSRRDSRVSIQHTSIAGPSVSFVGASPAAQPYSPSPFSPSFGHPMNGYGPRGVGAGIGGPTNNEEEGGEEEYQPQQQPQQQRSATTPRSHPQVSAVGPKPVAVPRTAHKAMPLRSPARAPGLQVAHTTAAATGGAHIQHVSKPPRPQHVTSSNALVSPAPAVPVKHKQQAHDTVAALSNSGSGTPPPYAAPGAVPGLYFALRTAHFPATPLGSSVRVRVQLCNTSTLPLTATVSVLLPDDTHPLSADAFHSASGEESSLFQVKRAHKVIALRPRSFCMLPITFAPASSILHSHDKGVMITAAGGSEVEPGAVVALCSAQLCVTGELEGVEVAAGLALSCKALLVGEAVAAAE